MLYIKTPATTANLGCGFDSIGMAFEIYNELWAEEIDEGLEINILQQQSQRIPDNDNNLIYKTIKSFYKLTDKKLSGIRLIQKDDIPLTRGLGSSAACIVSGLLVANELTGVRMPIEEIVQLSAKIEGHPDNVAPALLGGIVVGALNEKELKYVRFESPIDLKFGVIMPSFPLSTEKARKVLPKYISHKDGVFNSSRTGLLIASLLTGKIENLQIAFEDKFHQPYRKSIIPDMDNIFKKAKEYGAKGVFLSGAGPTIIAVLSNNDSFESNINNYLISLKGGWEYKCINPDNTGAVVLENQDCSWINKVAAK